ncbi:helix-turn-helix domain-containing protein [Rhodococcus pyridinivorans]|uniref:helix-turn-helix domain-containing protein n=1 Tax=Rhodococcus pyridinivorans TaxID=103816 RepID=UPI0029D4162B|nr:helix-turn-helix domain-containing protein [Rhodococcus pyridinivorans]
MRPSNADDSGACGYRAVQIIERNLIRERTAAGLAAAKARGRVGGRPAKMTPKKIKQAKVMRDNGMTQVEIAEILDVGRTTLYRHLK